MIRLSNGHILDYIASSGALGFDGKGWWWEKPLVLCRIIKPQYFTVVTKTLTRFPQSGNFFGIKSLRGVYLVKGGVANAMGLGNKGIRWWCKTIGPRVNRIYPLVLSLYAHSANEMYDMVRMVDGFDLVGIEINVSCPNIKRQFKNDVNWISSICRAAKSGTRHPLILKVSVNEKIKLILPGLEGVIEAISINSVPWPLVFPDKKSPLAKYGGGGVSGKIVQPITWGMVKKIVGITTIPVIGPSVWNYGDIKKLKEIGAKAVGFGSVFLRYPWRPTLYVWFSEL